MDDETVASDAEVRADGFEDVDSIGTPHVEHFGDPDFHVDEEDQGVNRDDVRSVHAAQEAEGEG